MKRIMGVALLAVLPLILVGCFEMKQDSTVNPDGSGKVLVEMTQAAMPPMNMGSGEAAKMDPEMMLKGFAKKILEGSKGIETWADVSIVTTDDGRMTFKGTGYFKDVTKVQSGEGDASGTTWAKDEKGGMVLTLDTSSKNSPEKGEAKPVPATEEEMTKAIQAAKMQWQQMKPMMEMMLAKLKMDMIFRLPGTLAEVEGFTKQADGSVRVTIEGAKLLAVMDKRMADEDYLKAAIKAGKDPMQDKAEGEKMMNEAAGIKGSLKARVTGDLKPAFDFEKEVAAAKAAYPKMIEKLGLDKAPAGGEMTAPKAAPAPAAEPAPVAPKAPAAK